jgi:release factor glutamine methyltransferase
MSADPWPIRRLLQWTQQFLRDKGVDSPRLDAEILLAHTLGCKRIDLYVRSDEIATDAQRAAFRDLIKKRVYGCPVAYLVGQREFFQLNLDVTPDVLIPRPETELVVLEALRVLKGKAAPRVLDVGTGSGCIALAIAHQAKNVQATAVDISASALAVAKRNADKHGLSSRVRFLESDLFAKLGGEKFDLIVSNPPYIAAGEFAGLAKDVRDFEPRLALDGGPDGLDIYRRLIAAAPAQLEPEGSLLLEIGAGQEAPVRELIAAQGRFGTIVTHRDGQKLPRVLESPLRRTWRSPIFTD